MKTKNIPRILATDPNINTAYTDSIMLKGFQEACKNDFKKIGVEFKFEYVNTEVAFNMRNMRLPSSLLKQNKPIIATQVSEIEDPYQMFNRGGSSRDIIPLGESFQSHSIPILLINPDDSPSVGFSLSVIRKGFNIEHTVIFSTRSKKSVARNGWEYLRQKDVPFQFDLDINVIIPESIKTAWIDMRKLDADISLGDLCKDMRQFSAASLSVERNDGSGIMEIIAHIKVPTIMKYSETAENFKNNGNMISSPDLRRAIEASFVSPTAFILHTVDEEMIENFNELVANDDEIKISESWGVSDEQSIQDDMVSVYDIAYTADEDQHLQVFEIGDFWKESANTDDSDMYDYWKYIAEYDGTVMENYFKYTMTKNNEDTTDTLNLRTLEITHTDLKKNDSFSIVIYANLDIYNQWRDATNPSTRVKTGSDKDIMYPNK